jgi:hypothetical protein
MNVSKHLFRVYLQRSRRADRALERARPAAAAGRELLDRRDDTARRGRGRPRPAVSERIRRPD